MLLILNVLGGFAAENRGADFGTAINNGYERGLKSNGTKTYVFVPLDFRPLS